MDFRNKDEYGKTICPNCDKHYIPDLPEREPDDDRPIQNIYPKATAIQREQLVTGICSDDCWKKYLGVSDNDEDDIEEASKCCGEKVCKEDEE